MKLAIKKIKIDNFKGFRTLEFSPDINFNIIIGENNIGKSSIFEAVQLWKRCYDLSIKSDNRGFYKSNAQSNLYLPFSDLYFLRITSDRELYNTASHTCNITMVLYDSTANRQFSLGFEIVKPSSISNAYYKVRASAGSEFDLFAAHLSQARIKLSKSIFIYQTRPVANVLAYEPIMNIGQISKKIEKGKSQEVLRNKIVTGRTLPQIKELEEKISSVVNYEFNFDFVNSSRKDLDEYIDLKIKKDGKSLDLHLQGSGFLQVAEIFSTITYVEAPLSILLVDEPDSHIHTTLQKSLIDKLKEITTSQILIISHNDNFVGEAKEGELYYLNSTSKSSGSLNALALNNFDLIKKELGGTIIALEKINICKRIAFVEGNDDIGYIEKLIAIHNKFNTNKINSRDITYFYQRGKNDLKRKLENVNRFLAQAIGRKPYVVVYDKDFCTIDANQDFATEILTVTPRESSCFSHNGYCIESVMFEDIVILSKILSLKKGINSIDIFRFVRMFESNILIELSTITSVLHQEMNNSFNGQKTVTRPELNNVTFGDFVRDCISEDRLNLHFTMNKRQIKKFVIEFNQHFGTQLLAIPDGDECESFAKGLFELYISECNKSSLVYPGYSALLAALYN